MKPAQTMKKGCANKSTSDFTQSTAPSVVTRGKKVKTYGQVTRLKKKRSKNSPSSEVMFGLRSRKAVNPIPPQYMAPPTLKRYDEESLVGGIVHTVPQPGPSFQPVEDYNIDFIVEQQQEEYEDETASPIITNIRSLIPLIDLTKDDDEEDKVRNEEKTNELVDDVKPEVFTPSLKKAIVRRRSRKPVKDISIEIVRKVSDLKTKSDFLLKVQREFIGLKNNSELWPSIAMEIPNCWIFLETLLDSKHATKH